jgi:hypothetical protein
MRNGLWTKVLILGITLLFLGTSSVSAFNVITTKNSKPMARGSWLYVGGSGPGNYTTIQSAVDAASPDDTIFVYNGIYFENVQINKSINLIGENIDNTIIDGGGVSDCIFMNGYTAYMVNISNFSLRDGDYGIDCEMHGQINTISHCRFYCGIEMFRVGNYEPKIIDCIFNSSATLEYFYNSQILNCIFYGNDLRLWHSFGDIENCLFYGGGIEGSGCMVENSIFCNGGVTISGADAGGLSMTNCTIYNSRYGVDVYEGDCYLKDCRIYNNSYDGIVLANGGIITNCSIYNNLIGISSGAYSLFDTLLTDCLIQNNSDYGILFYGSPDVNHNTFIYHNNFIDNGQNANSSGNYTWFNTSIKEGNYWSDYNGTDDDGDGIGDTPYNVPGGSNQDLYPFMNSNGWLNKPPNPPTISGPHYGKINTTYTFSLGAITDPDGDQLYCQWAWGDGNTSGWIGPYNSGQPVSASHAWSKPGNYTIKVKLKDIYGAESESAPFSITIVQPKTAFFLGTFDNISQTDDLMIMHARFFIVFPSDSIIYQARTIAISKDYLGYTGTGFTVGVGGVAIP